MSEESELFDQTPSTRRLRATGAAVLCCPRSHSKWGKSL